MRPLLQSSLQRPLVAAAIVCLLTSALAAQPGPPPARSGPRYDKTTETTIDGTVKEVLYPDDGRGRKGLHSDGRSRREDLDRTVHLGPASYVESKDFSFATGDAIGVVGSRVELDGKPVLIARQITRGDAKLELRDEEGRPLWASGRR